MKHSTINGSGPDLPRFRLHWSVSCRAVAAGSPHWSIELSAGVPGASPLTHDGAHMHELIAPESVLRTSQDHWNGARGSQPPVSISVDWYFRFNRRETRQGRLKGTSGPKPFDPVYHEGPCQGNSFTGFSIERPALFRIRRGA